MSTTSTDRIEKQIDLKAPVSRVWRALTDYREFNAWFGVTFDTPFVVGQTTRGRNTHPGHEHMTVEVVVRKMETERLFAYTWHPYAVDPKADYSQEPPTLVEFLLEEIPSGTRLRVRESGFDSIPASRRPEAFRRHEAGWAGQMQNIANHVAESH